MGPDAFDFWLGAWHCSWEGGGGSNEVTRAFADAVIVENFRADGPEPFTGMSVSVFDPTSGWRQTWVDSNGSYWHFVGAETQGGLSFATTEAVDADHRFKRMVFEDISDEGFHWRWSASEDGRSWTDRWAIDYRRSRT